MRYILIFAAILLMACVIGGLGLFWKPANTSGTFNSDRFVSTESTAAILDTKRSDISKHTETQYTDPETFYQTIIDNNIFRPLNWEPPQRISAYTLLGTTIATDSSSAEAYITERKSNQFYAVSVDQQVGEMIVKTITPKSVTLIQNGEVLTLSMSSSQFLNYRGSRSMPPNRDDIAPHTTIAVPIKNQTSHATNVTTKPNAANEWRKHLEEKVAKIRAERKRLTEYLKQHQSR